MQHDTNKNRGPREFGAPWSLLFIPLLFVGAALSIPYTFVRRRVLRQRERVLQAKMAERGRLIEWNDLVAAVGENRGTLIEERYSFKGPVRWWWVSENLYEVCPYPAADWLTMVKDESFIPLAEWCRKEYTNPDSGRALLVSLPPQGEGRDLWQRLRSNSGTERWIEVPPPEVVQRTVRRRLRARA